MKRSILSIRRHARLQLPFFQRLRDHPGVGLRQVPAGLGPGAGVERQQERPHGVHVAGWWLQIDLIRHQTKLLQILLKTKVLEYFWGTT